MMLETTMSQWPAANGVVPLMSIGFIFILIENNLSVEALVQASDVRELHVTDLQLGEMANIS